MKNLGRKKKCVLISIAVSLATLGALCAIAFAYFVSGDDFVSFDNEKFVNVANNLTITDANGKVVSQAAYINNRKIADIDSINDYTLNAFIGIEDKRFYNHNGVDFRGIARAVVNNVKSGSLKEGASTISQQLIKNTHLASDKTFQRKLNETLLALQLEKEYTKKQILEMYLNTIYFGGSCFGIESAANVYFNKSTDQLTLEESATLAGMLKAPNHYSPVTNPERCLSRRNLVLKTMLNNGLISQSDCDKAVNTPIVINGKTANVNEKDYVYAIISEACDILQMTPLQLYNSDLTITSYYDADIQSIAKNAIIKDTTMTENGNVPQKTALVIDNESGGIVAIYSVSPYDVLRQKRQIGSVIKPVGIYAPAIEEKMLTVCTPILDDKISFGGYVPKNYDNTFSGWVSATTALSKSLNIPAIKLLNSLGVEKSAEYLAKNGIKVSEEDKNLTLAVGSITDGLDVISLSQAYLTLANGGDYSTVGTIKSISNDKGLIYAKSMGKNKVFSQSTTYLTTNMLLEVAKSGTAKQIGELPYQVAVKTGTAGNSNSNTDALICGYTTKHTFSVLISESQDRLPTSVSGGNQPVKICNDLLNGIYADVTPDNFIKPDSIVEVEIDKRIYDANHKIVKANHSSKEIARYYFDVNNQPKEQKAVLIQEKPVLSAKYEDGTVKVSANVKNDYCLVRKCGKNETVVCKRFKGTFFDTEVTGGKSYQYKLILNVNGNTTVVSKITIGLP